jgi:two-component system cell cycle sensor histidine kinase/response regulator CckA
VGWQIYYLIQEETVEAKDTTKKKLIKEPSQGMPAGHGESIFVVEDEDDLLKLTKEILERHGYKVITANDGKEAIALYLQNKEEIKVVLIDVMMPVMGGSASIRELRKVNPEIKIIAVSGLIDKDRLTEVADLANAFLSKPFTTKELLQTIHEVMSK